MQDNRPKIFIMAPQEDLARLLKTDLERRGVAAYTEFDLVRSDTHKQEAFAVLLRLFPAGTTDGVPSYRTQIVAPAANLPYEFEVEMDGLYTKSNLDKLCAKAAAILSHLRDHPRHANDQSLKTRAADEVGERGKAALARIIGKSTAIRNIKDEIERIGRDRFILYHSAFGRRLGLT